MSVPDCADSVRGHDFETDSITVLTPIDEQDVPMAPFPYEYCRRCDYIKLPYGDGGYFDHDEIGEIAERFMVSERGWDRADAVIPTTDTIDKIVGADCARSGRTPSRRGTDMEGERPRRDMSTLHDLADTGTAVAFRSLGAIIGAAVGMLGGLYARRQAVAAVEVRPELATVGFIDAAFTNHAHDWLYYQYPTVMIAFSTIFAAIISGVAWYLET